MLKTFFLDWKTANNLFPWVYFISRDFLNIGKLSLIFFLVFHVIFIMIKEM